jgi:hypothetical protein
MPFEITTRVHYGYMREPGVYDDLTEADMVNLSAPSEGRPHGFGRVVESPKPSTVESVKKSAAVQPFEPPQEQEPRDEASPSPVVDQPAEPPAVGGGPDDPAQRPADPEQGPFPCRSEGCRKGPFPAKVGRDTHERKAHGKTLD